MATMDESRYRIEVDAQSVYVEDQSDPAEQRYLFAYTITIRNTGRVTAQLLSRHWLITDADGNEQEVRGEGVVGEQPTLAPGEGFRYTSAALLPTPVGTMQGSYQMRAEDGTEFEAPIAPFGLRMSGMLH